MDILISQLFAGLSLGSILLLAAVGLSLTFGQMGVINLAHGEFIMAGAYTAFTVQMILGSAGLSLLLSIPIAFVVGGIMGLIIEGLLLRRMYHRPLDTLLVTFGVSLVLQQLARDVFGAPSVDVRLPDWLSGPIDVLGVPVPASRVFILGLTVVVVCSLVVVLTRTSMGRRIRAVVFSRDLAESSGISSRRMDQLTFFIGSGLAGVAGVAITLIGSTSPTIGANYIVDAFLVVIAGGIGQIRGAVIAAAALGLLQVSVEWGTGASVAKVVALIAVVAFLQFRPQGLFTTSSRGIAA